MTNFKYQIKPETAALGPKVEELLDQVFGKARSDKASYQFRQGVDPIPELSWVALDESADDQRLVGTIRFWPVQVGDDGHPALLLGPLGIATDLAGKGIGRALTFRSLEIAAGLGYDIVLLVGDYDYYKRFGFVPATPYGFVMPGESRPERLQVTELKPGVLGRISGEIRHAHAMPPAIAKKARRAGRKSA